jgi:hypothetical protein
VDDGRVNSLYLGMVPAEAAEGIARIVAAIKARAGRLVHEWQALRPRAPARTA